MELGDNITDGLVTLAVSNLHVFFFFFLFQGPFDVNFGPKGLKVIKVKACRTKIGHQIKQRFTPKEPNYDCCTLVS